MAAPQPEARRRPRVSTIIGAGAVAVTAALVVTLAVVWPGFDARQTPVDDGTVWAVQTGAADGYARVNLELGELDTVKTAENASALAQTSDRVFVFSDGDTQFADVDLTAPIDLLATTEDAYTRTPAGTQDVASGGDLLVFRTDLGAVYAATLSGGGDAIAIDPYADAQVEPGQERPRFAADAVAVSPTGILFAYSAAEARIIRADARTGRILGDDPVASAPAAVQLSSVADRWILLDETTGDLRVRGRDEPIPTAAQAGARLQRSAAEAGPAYLADTDGLVRIDLDAGGAERVVDENLGTPAAPTPFLGSVHAAWLREGAGGGSLWSSEDGVVRGLDYGAGVLGDQITPEFVGNATRIALNEQTSGWVWTVPDGAIIPSSQQWDLQEQSESSQEQDTVSERVIDPKPPVAVDDAFGVRAGAATLLPVLLNDHDPNEDVLSIDPASVTGLDPAFGTVGFAGAEQQLAVQVAPGATGSATFSYRVTDGTTSDGLYSAPATVTLTVAASDQNSPPVWCGVEGCLAEPPRPTVEPGGTVTVDALQGWVDPEGDPIYLVDAVGPGEGSVAAQPDGTVTFQHGDPNATAEFEAPIALTVADARGATAQTTLTVSVTAAPEFTAGSFAVVGVAGSPVEVDVAPHVTGASGPPQLTKTAVLDEAGATVTPNATGLTMEVGAAAPGSYLVQYTVRDARGEATGLVRVTMRDPATAVISTPPLTAFVRPSEDAAVDVFGPVVNPAGLVLLLSDLRPESDPRASLSVDLVGQSIIRVSGSTDSGEPGTLGVVRYTLSDGSGSAAATAEGELTVILLPAPTASRPIAVDDAVTVRAGAQIDIPALRNDSAPAAALVALDPSQIVNESGAGLAFASGRTVRYLAPDEPGTYAIGYRIFRLGFPEATDDARIIVTVVGDESNRPPLPGILEGRVLSGEAVRIPFDAFAADPDGDAVTLDRIVDQPREGTAAISAEGDAIIYTSREGFSGQDAFTYQVRDAEGATGTAQVRVGVLAAESDPSPVTFSDYLQLQAGSTSQAVVRPADNDIDPAGGELTLVSVAPNAVPDTDEYAQLQAMLGEVDDGQVTIRAGDVPGTYAFTYTVTNDARDTSIGMIVVKVVRDRVADYPVVSDTTLTIETRDAFADGVDVLDGKVAWNTGDVSGLTLSLWGSHPGIRVSGWEISGAVPEESLLIPFQVSGTSFDGQAVTSYGFLRVPGDRDVRLSLRADASRIDVLENQSADLDMAAAVAVPAGASLVVDADGVRAGGGRPAGTCTVVSGTTIRYTAGAGAPWTDTCIVPVRLDIQDAPTFLTVRVDVEAEQPEPVLRSASLTVSPGSSATYNLQDMVGWAGKEDYSSLQYDLAYRGDQFTVTRDGQNVTVTAADAARPGREEAAVLALPSHPSARPAALNLVVGPAPSLLPKGGSTAQTCSQAGGNTSCTITVIGAAGEVNPLPGTPLTLVSVTDPVACPGVSFRLAGPGVVRASWGAETPGAADCTGAFTVADAQGRQSSGDRDGRVTLDLQGLPAAPTRVDWTGYTSTGVTLRVIGGSPSYPSIDGYRITASGRVVATCDASGACPAISAPAGERITYQARSFNAVGESRTAVEVTAWSYASPAAPTSGTFEPTPNGTTGGVATITVSGIDTSTGFIRLAGGSGGEVTLPVRGDTVVFRDYVIGSNAPTTLTATPLTRFDLPSVPGGSQEGSALSFRANGIGAPGLGLEVTASRSSEDGSVTATATVTANGVGERILVGFTDGAICRPSDAVAAGGGTASATFPAPLWQEKQVKACAVTEYKGRGFGVTEQTGAATPVATVATPRGDATYTVRADARGSDGGRTFEWTRVDAPTLSATRPFTVRYSGAGIQTGDFGQLFRLGASPGPITAAACHPLFGCSDEIAVTPTGAAYTAAVTFPAQCRSEDAAAPRPTVSANPSDYALTTTSVKDADGVVTWTYELRWQGQLTGLNALVGGDAYVLECAPPPPPPAEPDPEPEPPAPPTTP
ncbi:Ig-like domain-containing protein [Microbacterium sp. W1N]|uniref:Ig-like domain-containing protein n=1 Tax=Microbacterium festucae TaxID=2977531 RepID=UPI0021C1BF3A|nr:Ig-like domain-containing protein [Microbacterium festucae]MCT9820630.1 Ig-like domain-containing protein [Microbacterium festucae]